MAREELSEDKKAYILELVQAEHARSIGFDGLNSGELQEQRERALNYIKGEMPDLVVELAGRSKVVDTAVADAIETAMPELMDIFTGGEDVVAFEPKNQEDEAAAQQEQEYLHHILFNRNSGWMTIYEVIKDALSCKTGIFSWRWDGEFAPQPDNHENVGFPVLERCIREGHVENIKFGEPDDDGVPTVSFEYTPKWSKGRIVIEAIAPEDLAVAVDTRTLATGTYSCVRSRPRQQQLLAMDYDVDLVESLPTWNGSSDQESTARDRVGESQTVGTSIDLLRQVEIYRHYIRVYDEDEKRFCLYHLVTGGAAKMDTLLDIEEVSRVQLSAITPYLVPHRFYGESVADKLLEIQKIKTALKRMALDSAFFALNQRHEIVESGLTEDTLNDYLQNEPGMPVRVKHAGTINPLTNGKLPYDPLGYLEHFETEGEKRTGIVRNAQGLNPDTLHDTKGGMEILQNNAQKRLRLIARTIAETGYKDFLVNLHATIRENGGSMKDTVRLRNEWVDIDPSTWRQRDDMVIKIGVGAGGREHDIIVGQQIGLIIEQAAAAQQIPDGPLVNKKNIYNAAVDQIRKLGEKAPERYISNPEEYQAPPPGPPPPDPALVKAQMDAQNEAARLKLEEEKALAGHHLEVGKADAEALAREQEAMLQAQRIETEDAYKRDQAAAELAERQRQFDEQMAFEREKFYAKLEAEREARAAGHDTDLTKHAMNIDKDVHLADRVQTGGEPG